ncbi:MAG: hypothetical protein IJ717_12675 [Treponema sp.]|nr:hypothetical protein [Treponema sp.]
MPNQSQVDEMFEKFKEHCRDTTKYNLTTLDDILEEFNRWMRAKGYTKEEEEDETENEEQTEDILHDLAPDSDAADEKLDDDDGWVKM